MPLGYFAPNALMLIPATEAAAEHVTTSLLHFSDHTGNPTYEYVKYTFYSDNSVVVQTTFYDPKSFLPLGPPHTFTSSMDKGVSVKTPSKKLQS
jgi:hypothetical protein